MSFDLYFYTRKEHLFDASKVESYLVKNGCVRVSEDEQWVYENEDTDVYFDFERQPENDDPEDNKTFESFDDFNNTRYSFSLNYIRPNFFGLEAFPFVELMMSELDLFALNPQSDSEIEIPRRQTAGEYYSNWSNTNLSVSSDHFDYFDLLHFPLEKSNEYWRYNFHRNEMQDKLGDDYYVPTLILARQASTGEPITISTWTEHIPNVFPPADYFLINRKKRKLFRTAEESGLISHESFIREFGSYLEPFDFEDCFIIHPENAVLVGELFNKIEFEAMLEGFVGDGIDLSKLTNADRSAVQKDPGD